MSNERRLGMVALIAGCVALLASCGGTETTRNAASAAPAMETSSSTGEISSPEDPRASSTASEEGHASKATGEQAQTEGPAMAIRKSTFMCVRNLSKTTPVVTFTTFEEQSGQGPLQFRARACATGYAGWTRDVEGRIALPAPNEPMKFWANNFPVGSPDAGLEQERYDDCINYVSYSVGDRRTWDDGLLMYTMEREPDGEKKMFELTIRDSEKRSADNTPAKCPTFGAR